MQAYGPAFARVYNLRWAGFARQVAPRLLDFYSRLPAGQTHRTLLDLCCGTGQLTRFFLEQGYRVTGLDLSSAMLAYARENSASYEAAGQARFVEANAANFTLDESFGLIASTYDALNHLDSLDSLRQCFRCVRAVLAPEGAFVFDLNTRTGLYRWNNINVDESDDALVITRGMYDGGPQALTRLSGFVRAPEGHYERFEETVYNTVFELSDVREALLQAGWRTAYFAGLADLSAPLDAPEAEGRVFVVARG